MIALRDRVVEILCDRGPTASERWKVGSGFLIGGNLVLTSMHVIESGELIVRGIKGNSAAEKPEWPATIKLRGDVQLADLALLEVEGDIPVVGRSGFARVSRDSDEAAEVPGWAIGFPKFKEISNGVHGAMRDTAQVSGAILVAEDLNSGLLTLYVRQKPRPLPAKDEELGRSAWSGISGAAVVSGDRIVGVISEHHPPEGESALTVTPITDIMHLPKADEWWQLLGIQLAWLPSLPARPCLQVGQMPALAECYQERPEYSADIEARLAGAGLLILAPERTGTGGVGTTQLALNYAHAAQSRGEVDLLVWVTAMNRAVVADRYRVAAAELNVESFLDYLQTTKSRWLVVLDGVRDVDHLAQLRPSSRPNGRVLITTSSWEVGTDLGPADFIEVGPFTERQATAYIACSTAGQLDDADRLSRKLGFQPLALAQAASTMGRRKLDVEEYLHQFGQRHRKLPNALLGQRTEADSRRSAMIVTWSLAVEPDRAPTSPPYQLTTARDGSVTLSLLINTPQQSARAPIRPGGGGDD